MTRFDGQVIEHFTYHLSTDAAPDRVFFEGVALFGYFPEWALERQRQRYPDPDWSASQDSLARLSREWPVRSFASSST